MGEAIRDILHKVEVQKNVTSFLRENSDFFPEIFVHKKENEIYLSTLVRVCKDGKYHDVHLIECCHGEPDYIGLYSRFIHSAYIIQHFYVPYHIIDSVSKNQMDEKDRLREKYPHNFPKINQ